MITLRFLGTGCGLPSPTRSHTSTWMEAGDARLLIDAGEPCSHSIAAAGLDPTELDAIVLTHAHADHVGGLPMLLQGLWLAGRRRPLPLLLPGALIDPLLAWLEAIYLPPRLLGFPLLLTPWEKAESHPIGPGTVSATPTTHLDGLRRVLDPSHPERFRAFSLDCRIDGRRVLFSGDLGIPDDIAHLLVDPIDLFVCELAHFSPETLFASLARSPVRKLCITHLAPGLASHGEREALLAAARQALPQIGEIRAPADGDTVTIASTRARRRVSEPRSTRTTGRQTRSDRARTR